jgi:hypothetical protein
MKWRTPPGNDEQRANHTPVLQQLIANLNPAKGRGLPKMKLQCRTPLGAISAIGVVMHQQTNPV